MLLFSGWWCQNNNIPQDEVGPVVLVVDGIKLHQLHPTVQYLLRNQLGFNGLCQKKYYYLLVLVIKDLKFVNF